LIRQLQRGLGGVFGGKGGRGGKGGKGGGGFALLVLVALGLFAWVGTSGWYIVQPQEVGVVRRLGEFNRQDGAGFHLKLPAPFERADRVAVERTQTEEIGFETLRGDATRDVAEESLMLTGDENIVDIDFTVIWRVRNASEYLFFIRDPDNAVKAVAESAMREVVGGRNLEPIITTERTEVEDEARRLMQEMLDSYQAGIFVRSVNLRQAGPPPEVIAAFRDVVNAEQDAEAAVNEATAYQNDIVPRARGAAARIVQEAEAYRARVVAAAEGEATRFNLIYDEYRAAPEVTRRRMYLETLEVVLGSSDKILIDGEASGGVVPYLPLNELSPNRRTSGSAAGGQ
jgi:membrane protease subunit HflK